MSGSLFDQGQLIAIVESAALIVHQVSLSLEGFYIPMGRRTFGKLSLDGRNSVRTDCGVNVSLIPTAVLS